jgi:hypothetical protein
MAHNTLANTTKLQTDVSAIAGAQPATLVSLTKSQATANCYLDEVGKLLDLVKEPSVPMSHIVIHFVSLGKMSRISIRW